jgi:hypothetical protein
MTDDERYRQLSQRSVFSLSADEHKWLIAERLRRVESETDYEWSQRQVGGMAQIPHEAMSRPVLDWLAKAWRWMNGMS